MQRLSFFQDQRFKMNPQMFQSLKLMELPVMDLREKIVQELERNPALEVLEDRSIVSLDDAAIQPQEEDDYFEATSDSGFIKQGGQAAADEQRRFIEGVLSRPETLQEHLLWQLQLEPVDDELRTIAEVLIQNLDEDGFHKEPPETLFRQRDVRIDEALRLVRNLDPVGCCVSNYHESLKVQAGLLPDAIPEIEEALNHLDLFEKEKFAELGRIMNRDEDDVRWFYEIIKGLSPFPGRQFALAEVRYVVPDIQIVRDEGEFVIILNEEEIPVLGISPFFMKIATSRKTKKSGTPDDAQSGTPDDDDEESAGIEAAGTVSRPARDFARENIKEARWFIHSVNLRNHTLLRVTRAILEFQRPFFINGPKYLAPLTLGDIAKELGVHDTTVSRIAHSKYIQTEWGIFELRYFFTNSISGTGSGGSQYSKEGVKATIQELVSVENRTLTDQEITGILAQRGITLARRTVSKYRKELDLGSSYTRQKRDH